MVSIVLGCVVSRLGSRAQWLCLQDKILPDNSCLSPTAQVATRLCCAVLCCAVGDPFEGHHCLSFPEGMETVWQAYETTVEF